jgi:methylated-DNA-protein-cysteine methyltransferase-like protein
MKDSRDSRDFFVRVYEVVRLVPPGRVTSYGAIARYLGTGGSARTVGWAMNGAHGLSNPVPAHRVVNRNGLLSGKFHFPGEFEMQQRLEAEGVLIKNDQVLNMKELFWDPAVELL